MTTLAHMLTGAQALAHSSAASFWITAVIIGCGSVIAATLLAEHFARKRDRNPFIATGWPDREPGDIDWGDEW